ncbi:MAG TPA: CoA transferase [Acetobacteraceae bacterium]|nr:CoA transferase [Acetobacteraceae bacterium]
MSGPLSGVRVIDLTINVLGPLATQVLGDAGADVIKIEAPGGDPMRKIGPSRTPLMGTYYLNCNRNKRSVVLDLKREAGRAAMRRLIETADVFVHNMRIAAMERLGFGYAAAAAINPRLIYAASTGFRRASTAAERGAFDDIVQGWSGLAALNAGLDGTPRFVPTVMADKITGLALASAVGMALYAREKTGKGQQLHVPMVETLVQFTLIEHLWGATLCEPALGLGYGRMLSPHRRPYRTKDGFITVLGVTDDQWRRLFAAIGQPGLIDDPRFSDLTARTANVDAMLAIVADALAARTTAEWTRILDEADVPNGAVNTLEGLLDDAYLQETGFFQRVTHPTEGPMNMMAIPPEFDGTPGAIRRLPPKLGEHTCEVLAEAGLGAAEIEAASGL